MGDMSSIAVIKVIVIDILDMVFTHLFIHSEHRPDSSVSKFRKKNSTTVQKL